MTIPFPRMFFLRQNFPVPPPLDIPRELKAQFAAERISARITPGMSIAVGVGSRGIARLSEIVAAVLGELKAAGARPFIIPAMGSHGGGTPLGQIEILAGYGVTEERMGAPIRASMDVQQLGTTADGVPVFHSVEAARADAIVVINRIKPHTDFRGPLGSGVMKMLAIGLGKRTGAEACHIAASRLGHERVVRSVAQVILRKAPFLCGVGILENQIHDTAKLAVLPRETLEAREAELLGEAAKLLPKLPFDDVDLLIVDALGKNISGAGMDTNVIHRGVQGYSSSLIDEPRPAGTPAPPRIRRIFVRGLTPETHGNAVGIGMADFTTTRLVNAMDRNATYINALTALTGQCAKIPVHFDSDRDAIAAALASLAVPDTRGCKVIRIADTLSLKEMEVSEAYLGAARERGDVAVLGEPCEMQFDGEGNLALKAI